MQPGPWAGLHFSLFVSLPFHPASPAVSYYPNCLDRRAELDYKPVAEQNRAAH